MRLSMMAMASNRLAGTQQPEIKMTLVYETREEHGGSSRPETGGNIVRIPSIAALEPFWKN